MRLRVIDRTLIVPHRHLRILRCCVQLVYYRRLVERLLIGLEAAILLLVLLIALPGNGVDRLQRLHNLLERVLPRLLLLTAAVLRSYDFWTLCVLLLTLLLLVLEVR